MNIIFVYNADSGKLNTILDIAHKAISPSTYKCSLCSLTHDTLNEKSEWSRFRESSNHTLEFLHKDEFEEKYKAKFQYPVILENSDGLKILISNEEMGKLNNVTELIARVEQCEN